MHFLVLTSNKIQNKINTSTTDVCVELKNNGINLPCFGKPVPEKCDKTGTFRLPPICRLACYVEMMGLIGAGNNPMVGMTVAVAVAVSEAK